MSVTFIMDRRGNYAVYASGKYTGYNIYRNGGDMFPTFITYNGSKVADADTLEQAKGWIVQAAEFMD